MAAASGGDNARDYIRVDVSLPYDSGDLGTYLVANLSDVFCYSVMNYIIWHWGTQAQTTVPYVTLSLVTSGPLPNDNSARGEYNFQNATYNLGTFFSTGWGTRMFRTAVEIKGQVLPNSYSGTIEFRREIVQGRVY